MTKRFGISKLFALWIVISSVIIIAGITLMALLGFNYTQTKVQTLDVNYNYAVVASEQEDSLKELCINVIEQKGISFSEEKVSEIAYGSGSTGEYVLTYTLSGDLSVADLQGLENAIEQAISSSFQDISVSYHIDEAEILCAPVWRGAVAISVGVVLSLIYVAFRFGIGSAIVGLVASVNGAGLTLGLLAITRLPVFFYAPTFAAVVAATLSLLLWLVLCIKMRENFKQPAYVALSAEEAIGQTHKESKMLMIGVFSALAIVLVLIGAAATASVRTFMIPVVIALILSGYSAWVFAPALYVPIKAKIGMKTSGRRYVGKEKSQDGE